MTRSAEPTAATRAWVYRQVAEGVDDRRFMRYVGHALEYVVAHTPLLRALTVYPTIDTWKEWAWLLPAEQPDVRIDCPEAAWWPWAVETDDEDQVARGIACDLAALWAEEEEEEEEEEE